MSFHNDLVGLMKQVRSLLFSIRESLNKGFDLVPFIIVLANAVDYAFFTSMYVIPMLKKAEELGIPYNQILQFTEEYPVPETYLLIHEFFTVFFECSLVVVLILFIKSKELGYVSRLSIVTILCLIVTNTIYKNTPIPIDLYYLLAISFIFITFVILTIRTLINR